MLTFDFEGFRTVTRIAGSGHEVRAGRPVTLKSSTVLLPHGFFTRASIVLEAKAFGSTHWRRVGVAEETWDGVVHPAVRGDGTYPLRATAHHVGPHRLPVTIGRTPGNLPGRSLPVGVTVTR